MSGSVLSRFTSPYEHETTVPPPFRVIEAESLVTGQTILIYEPISLFQAVRSLTLPPAAGVVIVPDTW